MAPHPRLNTANTFSFKLWAAGDDPCKARNTLIARQSNVKANTDTKTSLKTGVMVTAVVAGPWFAGGRFAPGFAAIYSLLFRTSPRVFAFRE
jgi:hypothetical protein